MANLNTNNIYAKLAQGASEEDIAREVANEVNKTFEQYRQEQKEKEEAETAKKLHEKELNNARKTLAKDFATYAGLLYDTELNAEDVKKTEKFYYNYLKSLEKGMDGMNVLFDFFNNL